MCSSKMYTLHIMGLFNLSYATIFYVFGGFSINAYLVKGISDIFVLFFYFVNSKSICPNIYGQKKHVYDAKFGICANLPNM